MDERPSRFDFLGIYRLRQKLRGGHFVRVYDLQTSGRSAWYFWLMRSFGRPQWSGSRPARPTLMPIVTVTQCILLNVRPSSLRWRDIPQTPFPELYLVRIPSLPVVSSDISHLELPNRYAFS